MDNLVQIKTIVELTMAKIDILKMKADGYTWSCHVDESTREKLEATLVKIDSLLEQIEI